jgi:hypothetical protein
VRRGQLISMWAVIASVAVGLRYWHLRTGLAQGFFFPDEIVFHDRIAAFFPPSWAALVPRGRLWSPTLYSTASAVAALGAHGVGLIGLPHLGIWFWGFLLVARVVAVLASLATIPITACVGTRAFGRAVGLLAAALVAVAPIEVMQAHFASVDPMLVLWMTAATTAALHLAPTGSATAAALGGAAVGLAFATKYSGLAGLVPVAWALGEYAWRTRAVGQTSALALVALVAALAAAAIACPAYVVRTRDVLQEMRVLADANMIGQGQNNFVPASLGWYGRPHLYELVVGLPFALGFSFAALALAGVLVAAVRWSAADRILLAAIVPYFLAITSSDATFHRYLMPIVPPLAVLGARAVFASGVSAVRLAIALLVVAHTAAYGASLVARLVPDQQEAVAAIAREHRAADANARVVVPNVLFPYTGLLAFLRPAGIVPTEVAFGHWTEARPEVVILPEWVAVFVRRSPPSPDAVAELDRLESGAAGYREALRLPPAWFLHDGVYARLDPALRTDWWGRTGFRVYVRRAADAERF